MNVSTQRSNFSVPNDGKLSSEAFAKATLIQYLYQKLIGLI